MSKDYTAEVRWEDGQRQATVTDVPGAQTFARTPERSAQAPPRGHRPHGRPAGQ